MKLPVTVILGAAIASSSAAAFAFFKRSNLSTVTRSISLVSNVASQRCIRNMGTTATYAASLEFAKSEIASSNVVVFSKTYCPYCTATKSLFNNLNIPAKVIELDQIANGDEIQSALLEISGQRTVPNVFIKGTHLGGNDVTQAAAKSGKLQEMLNN